MTPRHRRPSALALSSLAIGALAVTGLVAGPASPALEADGAISGTITTPAVAGTHRYVVQAWDLDGDPQDAELAASTAIELGAGAKGGYTLSGLDDGSYVVRVVEKPADGSVPAVADRFWLDTDWVGDSTQVTVAGGTVGAVDLAPEAWSFSSARLSGSDRYGTSVASTQSVAPGVPVLYIASGAGWADALSAAPAAAVQGGALLLTDPDQLFPVTSAEITRLAPKKVVVVGSELTVSAAVYRQIDAVAGTVVRIGGTDRYDTSRRIVADAFPAGSAEDVFLATGGNFPDALSVGPVAGRLGEPVLLVDGANAALDAATRSAVSRLDPTTAVVLGQEPSISAGIQNELTSAGLVDRTTRIGGESRYATSRLINEAYAPAELTDTTYLASGEGFADALSGAAIAAANGSPISLSRPECVPAATVDSLKRLHLDYAVVLGSELTLSAAVGRVAAC